MPPKKNPIRPRSRLIEEASRRALHDILQHWIIRWEGPEEYGIDATVEICQLNKQSGDWEPTLQKFQLQLKSTEKSLTGKPIRHSVATEKIGYWYRGNLPVLFIIYSIADNRLYFRWINDSEELINSLAARNPNWMEQQKVSIPVEPRQVLEISSLPAIETLVAGWKVPARKIIAPGEFFSLKEALCAQIEEFQQIPIAHSFASINNALTRLAADMDQAIYRISVAGLSRVGKSSLINALLHTDLSPVDMFQTTGVPIMFLPGRKQQVTVYYFNGDKQVFPLSADVIRRFASQQENQGNSQMVRLLMVVLHNPALERGLALYDIPGLDDADEGILRNTWDTVMQANAVLYVIDVSSFRNHGFSFRQAFRADLSRFKESLEKLFLVLNKVDDLRPGQLAELQKYITDELQRFGLADTLKDQVFYVSATNSPSANGEGTDSLDALETALWSYVLTENKSGMARLYNGVLALQQAVYDTLSLLKARQLDFDRKSSLEKMMNTIQGQVPAFDQDMKQEWKQVGASIRTLLENQKNRKLEELQTFLEVLSPNTVLPGADEIRKRMMQGVNEGIENANREVSEYIIQLQQKSKRWLTEHLREIGEIISGSPPPRFLDLSNLHQLELTERPDLSGSIGTGVFSGLLVYLVFPSAAVFSAIASFFFSLILSTEDRQRKAIGKIMGRCKKEYDQTFTVLGQQYAQYMQEAYELTVEQARNYLNHYLMDLHKQLTSLGIPHNAEAAGGVDQSLQQLQEVERQVDILKLRIERVSAGLG